MIRSTLKRVLRNALIGWLDIEVAQPEQKPPAKTEQVTVEVTAVLDEEVEPEEVVEEVVAAVKEEATEEAAEEAKEVTSSAQPEAIEEAVAEEEEVVEPIPATKPKPFKAEPGCISQIFFYADGISHLSGDAREYRWMFGKCKNNVGYAAVRIVGYDSYFECEDDRGMLELRSLNAYDQKSSKYYRTYDEMMKGVESFMLMTDDMNKPFWNVYPPSDMDTERYGAEAS